MADPIDIVVNDKISPDISNRLRGIATDARTADSAVAALTAQIAALGNSGGALSKIQAALAANQTATANLATAQQRLQAATANTATAQTRLQGATTQSATATQNLLAATQRVSTAQAQGATAAQRLATEQQRTATQTANAAAASDRAALAALRLEQAQQRGATATTSAATTLGNYLRAALAAAGIVFTVKGIVEAGDAYTTLQNKLQNVATSQAQVNELTERLFDISVRSRQGIEETATAFTRFDRALKTLGKSQEESLRLTETVNKALIVSGANSQESASALLQLSQAFNSGKLQGDEFRAVSENLPIVLDAVAKALNVPINKVKEFSSQGKITSEVLFRAFKLIQDQVDATFAKTLPTVSQAFVVLKNRALEAFGEFNKSAGITQSLANGLIFLSTHLKELTLTLAIIGAAFLVAFGPVILTALATATGAVLTFTLALLANPIGLIVVGIVAAATALKLFGDNAASGFGGLVTYSDLARGALDLLKDAANEVLSLFSTDFFASFGSSAQSAIGEGIAGFKNFFDTTRTGFGGFLEGVAKTFDAIGGLLTGLAIFIGRAVGGIPDLFLAAFGTAYNFVAENIEKIVNTTLSGLNVLREAVGTEPIKLINIEKQEVDKEALKKYGAGLKSAFDDGFDAQGGALQKVLDNVEARAKKIRDDTNQLQREANRGGSNLRGSGPDTSGKPTDKAAEARALALSKINKQLDDEAQRQFTLQPLREAQQKFDQIEETLLGKKIKLHDAEKVAIRAKIDAIQANAVVQKEFDRIYNESIGPLRDYTATQTAAQKLLSQGAITQKQYNEQIIKSQEVYLNATDPLRKFNKELEQQSILLDLLPKQREIDQQLQQIGNELLAKGVILTQSEVAALRAKLEANQQANLVAQQESSIIEAGQGKRDAYINQLTAIDRLLANQKSGVTKDDVFQSVRDGGGVGDFLKGSQQDTDSQVAVLQTYYKKIDDLRQRDVISAQTAEIAKTKIQQAQQNLYLNQAKGFFDSLAQLSTSKNRTLAAIGKAAAISSAIINTYQSATGAYASLASIPYVGPFLGAAAAAAAIAAGLANVAQIRSQGQGFQQGGYTGDFAVNQEAGVVHGREYVFDANATSRIGVGQLEALRRGAASVAANAPRQGGGPANAATAPADVAAAPGVTVNHRTINVLDPNLISDYMSTPEGEQAQLNFISRNSDNIRSLIG